MEERHNWETIVCPIYQKLRPTGAILRQGFNINQKGERWHPYLFIEIDKNKFDYEDPFYGHQSSDSMFELTLDLDNDPCFEGVTHPSQLANRTFLPAEDNFLGMFSNSLEISVHELIFGAIEAEKFLLPLQITYSFTNSSSYAMMTGTLAEHRQRSGTIKTSLTIEPPVVTIDKEEAILMAINQLDTRLFDIERASPTKDNNGISSSDSIRYSVPYRNITQLPDGYSPTAKMVDPWLTRFYNRLSKQ
jgi:hypothetical protein